MHTIGRTRVPWEFLAAVGAIYAVELWIVASLEAAERPELLAAGITLDLTLLVPGLYWLTCIRRRGWPWITVVPVFVLSLLLASRVLPSTHHGALTVLEYAAAPLELALLGFIGWRAYRGYRRFRDDRDRERDPLDAMREAAAEIIHLPVAARIASYEMAIFYLALLGWRVRSRHDAPDRFTCYRDSSYGILLAALMMVMAIELIGVHVALHFWVGPTVAWIVTALSVYGVLWLLGDFQALRLRPIVLTDEGIRLRLGLRWEVELPYSRIRSVGPAATAVASDLKMAVFGEPQVRLELTEPTTVQGVYGLRREASGILLAVDSPERFRQAVAARIDRDA